jgi:hypothetical protein
LLLALACEDPEDRPTNPCGNLNMQLRLISQVPSFCDQALGEIVVEGESPNASVTYRLDDGPERSTGRFSALLPNSYMMTMTDELGCTLSLPVLVGARISFQGEIEPLLTATCAVSGCHVTGQQVPDFTNRNNFFTASGRMRTLVSSREMPAAECNCPLEAAEIEHILCWIDGGAEDSL